MRSYRLDSRSKRRPSGIRNLQVRHAEALLLAEEVRSKALLRHAAHNFILHLTQELRVQLDVLLALRLDLGFPRGECAGDVLEGGIALDGEFARNTRCC